MLHHALQTTLATKGGVGHPLQAKAGHCLSTVCAHASHAGWATEIHKHSWTMANVISQQQHFPSDTSQAASRQRIFIRRLAVADAAHSATRLNDGPD